MTTAAKPERRWRYGRRVVLTLACVLTLLCLALVVAAIRNDQAISSNMGRADAEVLSVSFDRTIIRFATPDGVVHIPSDGVLYPEGVVTGDLVRVEYATGNPELVRVAGRGATLTLLPVGTTLLVTWLVAGPLYWWLRRKGRER